MGAARSRQSRRHPLCRPGHYRGETHPEHVPRRIPHRRHVRRTGYCVPYQRGSNTEKDWASGSANWGNKSGNAFPDVFFNQAVTYNGSACTYDYNNSGGPRKWYNTTENPAATSPDSYRYTFFAYYPKDGFTVESPASATTRGVPKLTFTMPFGETGDVATTTLNDMQTPDAMVSVVYNHLRTTGNVASISATS